MVFHIWNITKRRHIWHKTAKIILRSHGIILITILQNISQLPDFHITDAATKNSIILNVTQNNDASLIFLARSIPNLFQHEEHLKNYFYNSSLSLQAHSA
ncbi:hypothetical protein IQ244_12350 [Nostoc sp. LEGE 06077]|uniref:hypothetical protein n=1 Tax=Nostoc sp. LEGE 06077 TaxID=915325 RepID=UPI001882DD10|nr:hypothetical protein [Nostoc sp. LEGE 06077]MBE9207302.1 hypothetical protein [Nostoc sp. LEGE 06077]